MEARGADPMLMALIDGYVSDPKGFPVTLMIGGFLVGGIPVSQGRYLEVMAHGDDIGGELLLLSLAEQVGAREQDEIAQRQSGGGTPREFVHLIDVTIVGAQSPISIPLWRCRVSDITGWVPGRMTVSNPPYLG